MRKFHRIASRRRLFLKSMANNLVLRGKIETTEARAKEIRPVVERFLTIAKKQNLASLRRLLASLSKQSAEKLYYDIAPRYQERQGGYTRIVKQANTRKRDGSRLVRIEFV